MKKVFTTSAMLFCLFALQPVQANSQLEGVTVPDTRVVDGTTVKLNGLGLRLATMLKVKVYVMALYLETPGNDAATIINSDDAARIELHMLRDVDAKDMRKAWSEGFEKNYQGSADLSSELAALKAATGDLKEGEVLAFEQRWEAFSSGRGNIRPEQGNEILGLARRHGIEPAPLHWMVHSLSERLNEHAEAATGR